MSKKKNTSRKYSYFFKPDMVADIWNGKRITTLAPKSIPSQKVGDTIVGCLSTNGAKFFSSDILEVIDVQINIDPLVITIGKNVVPAGEATDLFVFSQGYRSRSEFVDQHKLFGSRINKNMVLIKWQGPKNG